ncbi:GIY-YIG nuclease family protein [Kitasatospora sp. NPDC004614]|uniref:GIY-YIG nuclease family protein n=1 Tax=unclassified Kitasatospora TaxID=2633591 RepID=UPI0036BF11D3
MTSTEEFIEIALADGRPGGIRVATSVERACLCVAFGRADYAKARMRPELSRTGVYLVQGPDAEQPGKQRVYMGRARVLTERLDEHQRDKDFWTQGFAFTSHNDRLTENHVAHLEARLIRHSMSIGTAIVDNKEVPAPKEPRAEMRPSYGRLFEDVLLLMGVLGAVGLEEAAGVVAEPDTEAVRYRLKATGTDCWGSERSDGFLVRAGAEGKVEARSLSRSYLRLRRELIEDGILVETNDGKHLRLMKDHCFDSPSAAASVLAGVNWNGRKAWVDELGITLKDHQVGTTRTPPPALAHPDVQQVLFEADRSS